MGSLGLAAGLLAVTVLALLASASGAHAAAPPTNDAGEVLARLSGRWSWSDGQRIAYVDDAGALRLHDVWTNSSTVLVAPGPTIEDVRLAGDQVAFLTGDGLRSLVAGPLAGPHVAVQPEAGQLAPSLAGDGSLAWLDSADGQTDVWLRPAGAAPRPVTDDRATQSEPVANEAFVAWTDSRNTSPLLLGDIAMAAHPSNLDVFVLDRATGLTLQATDEPLQQRQPMLAGGRLVYLSQEGGGAGIFHRDPQQGIRLGREMLGDAAWRPLLIEGDGDRVAVLEGTPGAAALRLLEVGGGAMLGTFAPVPNAVALSVDRGVAAVEVIAVGGAHQVLVVRMPSALAAQVLPTQQGCWHITASGAVGPVRALHSSNDGRVVELTADAPGSFAVCGTGSVRLVDDLGASAPAPLQPSPASAGSPAPPAALAVLAVVAVAYARRR